MDLIHYVVKDGVLDPSEVHTSEDWEANRTVHGAMQRLEGLVQTALLAAHCQVQVALLASLASEKISPNHRPV